MSYFNFSFSDIWDNSQNSYLQCSMPYSGMNIGNIFGVDFTIPDFIKNLRVPNYNVSLWNTPADIIPPTQGGTIFPEIPSPLNLQIPPYSPDFWRATMPKSREISPFTETYRTALPPKDAKTVEIKGYNAIAGENLALTALKRAKGKSRCAKFVREALNISGVLTTAELGSNEHRHAYQWIGILRKYPKKFKEIPVTNTNYLHLPAGAIMIYERGVEGYDKQSGHIQISTGDGRAAHYCIQRTLKKPTAIFIPV